MKERIQILIILALTFLCLSCQSTKVYTKYEKVIYSEKDGNKTVFLEEKKDFKEKPKKIKDYNYTENENLTMLFSEEKVTVVSNTDFKFVAYSFFLKPLVITGSSIFCLGKCVGVSFSFFVFSSIDYFPEWVSIFNSSQDKQKMINAKYENRIEYYPELHKPFTKNHIIVEKTVYKTTAYKTRNEKTIIESYQKYEYDNTIYVKREINKDFYSTVYVVKYVGTIITIPITFTTMVAGILVNRAFIK